MTPLKMGDIISTENVSKIFSNVEVLIGINKVLMKDLETAASDESTQMLGKIAQSFLRLVCI